MQDNSGTYDAEYTNQIATDQRAFGASDNGNYNPSCNAMNIFNGTNTQVWFANIPIQPGGVIVFSEMRKGAYTSPMTISFDNPAHTGQLYITKIVKVKNK